jgi:hypothetical protein
MNLPFPPPRGELSELERFMHDLTAEGARLISRGSSIVGQEQQAWVLWDRIVLVVVYSPASFEVFTAIGRDGAASIAASLVKVFRADRTATPPGMTLVPEHIAEPLPPPVDTPILRVLRKGKSGAR